jgi:alpha-L-rhamnosidase
MNVQVNKNHMIVRNEAFIEKAEQLKTDLFTKKVTPVSLVNVVQDENAIHGLNLPSEMRHI